MVAGGKLDLLRYKSMEIAHLDLKVDAARLVLEGVTTFEEAERIIG